MRKKIVQLDICFAGQAFGMKVPSSSWYAYRRREVLVYQSF